MHQYFVIITTKNSKKIQKTYDDVDIDSWADITLGYGKQFFEELPHYQEIIIR